jgi:hypothetical protein
MRWGVLRTEEAEETRASLPHFGQLNNSPLIWSRAAAPNLAVRQNIYLWLALAAASALSPEPPLQRAPQQRVEPGEGVLPDCLRVGAQLVAGRVLAQFEPGPAAGLIAAGLIEEFQPQPGPGRPPGARYLADVGVPHQQLILDDLGQCHINRSTVTRVRVIHQHETLETACPDVALHGLVRHREVRGPEPLAQLVGIDESPVDQFARRVEDPRDKDFPTIAHRTQTTIPPSGAGRDGSSYGLVPPLRIVAAS